MADATYEGYVRHALGRLASTMDQSYEKTAADLARAAAAAAYLRCAEECQERVAGEPKCRDTCVRADNARRRNTERPVDRKARENRTRAGDLETLPGMLRP